MGENTKLTQTGLDQLAAYYKNKQELATQESLANLKNKLLKRLAEIEKELAKNSTLDDFYTSQRRAKKERKRDYLAMEKFKLKQELEKLK